MTLTAFLTNETDRRLDGLTIEDSQGGRVAVPAIEPGGSVTVAFRNPDAHSENSIVLVEPGGESYVLVSYFEYNLKGEVSATMRESRDGKLNVEAQADVVTSFEPAPE